MLYFGIDWSSAHHNLCILNEAGARVSQVKFEHSPSGFARIEVERCKLQVSASACPVAIETAHNLLVDYLLDREYPVYLVPPRATAGYRNRQRSSGAHDDDSDAALLASIMRTDRESHRRWLPHQPLTQQLAARVRLIETLRRSIQRQANQLQALLLRTYPTALGLFSELTTQIALQFLSAFPSASEAQQLSRSAFDDFCRAQGYTRSDLLPMHYAHLLEAAPQANAAVRQAYCESIRVLAQVLLPQVRARTQTLLELPALLHKHPDAFIFESLPNAGVLLAPALLVKFGDARERFPTAAAVQALAGTCPLTKHSGKRKLILFRRGCDLEFRRIAQQYALASLGASGWASAYWKEIRPRCHSDSHAYRVLANRWLAIIWKLWQQRQPYDEAHHLQQRALRRTPKT
ncbi:MAG TPA: transposase [Anaerolineales bacterium]